MVVTWVVWGWDVGGFTRWVVTSCGSLTHKLSHNKFPTDGALVGARSYNPNAHVAHIGLDDHIWSIYNVNGPTPPPTPPKSVVVDSSSSTSAFLHAFKWPGLVCQWGSGGIYFLFSPSGKLKTPVLTPTTKTRTRRDLNLNNALRKRKRTTWTELNWTAFLPSLFTHLIRSYSEAIPKRFRSS